MIYVASYDTNTGDVSRSKCKTGEVGLELAIKELCARNEANKDDGDPEGPVRYSGDAKRFSLVSAWSGGRQWFYMLTVYSATPFNDDDEVLAEELAAELDEDGDDDDE